MRENEIAKNLIDDANNMFKQGITQSPMIMIDAIEYKKYNFDLLEKEIAKFDFKMCKLEDAPAPINQMPLKNKFIIFKE